MPFSIVAPTSNLTASGLASDEAFGADTITLYLDAAGLATSEAFGAATITTILTATGLATSEAFGAAGPISFGLIETGLSTSEAFGADVITLYLTETGLSTSEAFGATTATYFTVLTASSLPSQEAFGTATISTTQFLSSTGLSTSEQFGHHHIAVVAALFAGDSETQSGSTLGGDYVAILLPGIDMSTAEDDFLDGVINPAIWATTTSSSASIREFSGTLQLATGKTAGSIATVRDVQSSTRFDFSADLNFRTKFYTGTAEGTFWFGAYASASNYCRAKLIQSRTDSRLEIERTGYTTITFTVPQFSRLNLRLLRVDEDVHVFLNGQTFWTGQWSQGAAKVEIGASSSGSANMVVGLSDYVRNPVIMFGDTPVTSFVRKSQGRVDILSPASDVTGAVTVTAQTYLGGSPTTLPDVFTYIDPVDHQIVGTDGTSSLRMLDDPQVRAA